MKSKLAPAIIKSAGYLISIVSVGLLGAVSWKSATHEPFLRWALIFGMVFSVLGMILRWISYQIEE